MRKIKFRFWNKSLNKWDYFSLFNIQLYLRELQEHLLNGDEPYLFIGKNDKNGKEIWEGDIVQFQENVQEHNQLAENSKNDDLKIQKIIESIPSIGFIKWDDGQFYIEQIKLGYKKYENGEVFEYDFYCPDGKMFSWNDLEVIGSVYENPELLGDK